MSDRYSLREPRPDAPAPTPLPLPCIDVHAHMELVTQSEPDSVEIRDLLEDAETAGIDRVVQVGYSAEQSKWSVRCVQDLERDLSIIEELASHPRVRAIGETGLDFFRTGVDLREKQVYSFRRHIALAKAVNKALVIHDRDAHRAVLDTLLEEGAPATTIFHCFSGDAQMARECIEAGYILSFAGTVTFKNAPELREAAQLVPVEQLLIETDSPFLAPAPNRGSLNTPAQVANIVRFVAELRGDNLEYLCERITENALRCFGSFD
jgi:TatD DNase family protein